MSADLARQFLDAMNAGDLQTALALLADDVEVRFPRETIRGLDAVKAAMDSGDDGGLDHLDVEIADRRLDEEGAEVRVTSRRIFRWKESGDLAYEQEAKARIVFEDGKIAFLAFGQRADEP